MSELWAWIHFGVDERMRAVVPRGARSQALAWELDEAERLLEAFDRSVETRQGIHDWREDRFVRDQDPRCTAKLSHYVCSRIAQWSARLGTDRDPEARARLKVARGASSLLHSLLGASAAEMGLVCAQLEIGDRWPYSTVFRSERLFEVVVETPEEGPVPSAEAARRREFAAAIWRASWGQPKKRRAVAGAAR